MNAVNAGSRDSLVTFGMAQRVSPKSILSSFLEALRQSRRREARRVIATYAHLVADRDAIINASRVVELADQLVPKISECNKSRATEDEGGPQERAIPRANQGGKRQH